MSHLRSLSGCPVLSGAIYIAPGQTGHFWTRPEVSETDKSGHRTFFKVYFTDREFRGLSLGPGGHKQLPHGGGRRLVWITRN